MNNVVALAESQVNHNVNLLANRLDYMRLLCNCGELYSNRHFDKRTFT